MDTKKNPTAFAASEWMETLIQECEDQVQKETEWPTLLITASGRRLIWDFCTKFGVLGKGVPGTACQLLERFLAQDIRSHLQQNLGTDEWKSYKDLLISELGLAMVSCIQLAAKMSELQVQMTATKVKNTLMKEGIEHSNADIVRMEFHVFKTLDFRLPLWSTLDVTEFLATRVGMTGPIVLQVVEMVIDVAEHHRDQLDLHMSCWSGASSSSSSPSNTNNGRVLNLPMCAGAVVVAARYVPQEHRIPDPTSKLATLICSDVSYVKAIADTLFKHIIVIKKYIPILKKRRLF